MFQWVISRLLLCCLANNCHIPISGMREERANHQITKSSGEGNQMTIEKKCKLHMPHGNDGQWKNSSLPIHPDGCYFYYGPSFLGYSWLSQVKSLSEFEDAMQARNSTNSTYSPKKPGHWQLFFYRYFFHLQWTKKWNLPLIKDSLGKFSFQVKWKWVPSTHERWRERERERERERNIRTLKDYFSHAMRKNVICSEKKWIASLNVLGPLNRYI